MKVCSFRKKAPLQLALGSRHLRILLGSSGWHLRHSTHSVPWTAGNCKSLSLGSVPHTASSVPEERVHASNKPGPVVCQMSAKALTCCRLRVLTCAPFPDSPSPSARLWAVLSSIRSGPQSPKFYTDNPNGALQGN